ncbi:hypothetical protein PSTT_01747 [Puccinia striiformis]|uniref:Uncharacterized protein n=1 Tax=Puccinia striiformis TaxID=27350 RepID=A0A2S4W2D7_9BASI|nr:hypothetical protein PSTT_01747 [Puccinia striiformis]
MARPVRRTSSYPNTSSRHLPPAAAIFVAGCGCDLDQYSTDVIGIPSWSARTLSLIALLNSKPTDSFEVDQTNLCDSISSSSCTKPHIGHLHAFYLIYKRMQAEERYGQEGYKYVGNATYASHFLRVSLLVTSNLSINIHHFCTKLQLPGVRFGRLKEPPSASPTITTQLALPPSS